MASGKRRAGRPKLSAEQQAAFRETIIDVAKGLFFEHGVSGVSIRNIATGVGCSPMTIYSYFENKHAILRCIWEVIFDELYQTCVHATKRETTPLTKLRKLCRAYLKFWLLNRDYFYVVYLTVDPETISLGQDFFEMEEVSVKKVYELIDSLIDDSKRDKSLSGASTRKMSQTLLISMFGILFSLITIPEYDWVDEDTLIKEVFEHFIRGYAPQ